MSTPYRIPAQLVVDQNQKLVGDLERDFAALGEQLARRGIAAADLLDRVRAFTIAIPSWGVGTGGTRFARFPGPGEPRDIYEKLDDCGTIQQLVRCAPRVSLHIPWDRPDDAGLLAAHAAGMGLGFDAVNSNTFQDFPGQRHSYKHGSLSHTDAAVRQQAVQHNLECVEIGKALGSKALTVWIADGSNYPGQQDFSAALDRYLDSMRQVYAALPEDWSLYLEHKLYEPAFYSTVINDWGTSFWCASQLGRKALCLVDLGHHAPSTNIEMVVARLWRLGKLGGLHFNDSKYGDDDLDSGSINPYQLFLIFNELTAAQARDATFRPAYMLDQSHNVTDPIESLMISAMEVQRAQVLALLVDREELRRHQEANDAVLALCSLKRAFLTDVSPLLAMARYRDGGAIDPVLAYRASEYRRRKASERDAR